MGAIIKWLFNRKEEPEEVHPDVQVLRITNPESLATSDLFPVIMETLKSNPWTDPKYGFFELKEASRLPHVAVLCAFDDAWSGAAVVQATSGLMTGVFVLHFHDGGSEAVRQALVQAVREFADTIGAPRIVQIAPTGAVTLAGDRGGRLIEV